MSMFQNLWNKMVNKPEETPSVPETIQYADITVILDKSASMVKMQQSVVDGFNQYTKSMKENPGLNKWTLVQFDDPHSARGAGESFPHETYSQCEESKIPYMNVGSYTVQIQSMDDRISTWNLSGYVKGPKHPSGSGDVVFVPRGGTALVDAMYSTVEKIDQRLSGRADVRPVVLVITDGEENSSHLHSSEELRELIARTQKKGFEYIYMGANQDSFHEAKKYGVNTNNMTAYATTPGSVLQSGAVGTANFIASAEGMRMAICSGFVGTASVASGSTSSGSLCNYRYNN